MNKRIFLVGYMGVGKTTLGKELAKRMNFQFIDLDQYIESSFNKSINKIFEEEGENSFRKAEQQHLQEVTSKENVVISTGGGTPCFFDNMDIMCKEGLVIYLKTAPHILVDRLYQRREKRPLIKQMTKEQLLAFIIHNIDQRRRFYESAHITFETDGLIQRADIDIHANKLVSILHAQSEYQKK